MITEPNSLMTWRLTKEVVISQPQRAFKHGGKLGTFRDCWQSLCRIHIPTLMQRLLTSD